MEKLYGCAEVAERYGVKIKTVWDWISSGKLVAVNTGRIYRVRESDLLAFENARVTANSAETN